MAKRLILEPVGWGTTFLEAPPGLFVYDWEVFPGDPPNRLLGFKPNGSPCYNANGEPLNLRPDHEIQPVKALWVED